MTKLANGMYEKVGQGMNILLFLYTFFGACFLTFREPFATTGNGYFASWAMVCGSAMALGMTASALKSSIKGLGAIIGLLASSVIVLIAIIPPLRDNQGGEEIYTIALACLTAFFLLVVLGLERMNGDKALPNKVMFFILLFFAVCWIVQACFVTFRGPFREYTCRMDKARKVKDVNHFNEHSNLSLAYSLLSFIWTTVTTGNGYFGSWAAAATSAFAAFAARGAE
mmetsp:Transcript_12397/g.25617  ORF Transcript_12397/g.25617 Transcript_12397/m.25617 type:complete len:226 (-) Transcript_12397:245-922(-)